MKISNIFRILLVAAFAVCGLLSTTDANAQRVIPAGETTASPGTYVNIGQAPLQGANINQDLLNGALYTNSVVRLWNGSSNVFEAWKNSTSNPAGSSAVGVGSVTIFQGIASAMNITAAATIKASAGRLFRVSVVVAGAAGTICDINGACTAASTIGAIPAVVGTYEFNWPMLAGIRIEPGAGQTVAITYQ